MAGPPMRPKKEVKLIKEFFQLIAISDFILKGSFLFQAGYLFSFQTKKNGRNPKCNRDFIKVQREKGNESLNKFWKKLIKVIPETAM